PLRAHPPLWSLGQSHSSGEAHTLSPALSGRGRRGDCPPALHTLRVPNCQHGADFPAALSRLRGRTAAGPGAARSPTRHPPMTTPTTPSSLCVPSSPLVMAPSERLAVVYPVAAPPSRPCGLLRSVPSPVWRSPLLTVVLHGLGIASPSLQPLAAPLRLVRIPLALT